MWLTPIYYWVASRSRIRSPQSNLNLGKLVLTAPGTSDVSHPIFPTPLGPPMVYLSTIRRQLAPTVGQVTFGASFQADSAHAGIGKTIAMGHVVYASDVPLILLDETWIPSKEPVTTYTIMSISEIDIYLSFAEPAQATFE